MAILEYIQFCSLLAADPHFFEDRCADHGGGQRIGQWMLCSPVTHTDNLATWHTRSGPD